MKRSGLLCVWFSLTAALIAADGESHAGVYRQWGGGIYAIVLTLLTNGNYLARWDADIACNGTASGSWKSIGDEIHLSPKKEDGPLMPGYLRVLLVREMEGRRALLRKEDVDHQDSPLVYFYLEKKPDQSPAATPAPRPPTTPSPPSDAPQR